MEKINIDKNLLKVYLKAFVFFAIDVFTKAIILSNGNIYFEKEIIKDFFKIHLVKNTGAAFSILQNNNILLVLIGFIVLYGFYKFLPTQKLNKLNTISYSMLIGGICGNLFDRIRINAVVDFLSFKIFSYDFPVFNFADVFIVIGAILLFIAEVFNNETRSKKK